MTNCHYPTEIHQRLFDCGVIAVVTIDRDEDSIPLAKALLACRINVMEITLRTDAAIDAIAAVTSEVPDCLVGAGTILRPDQIALAAAAGAKFGAAPGLNESVVESATDQGFPFAPGIMTPSELERAMALGCRHLKLYPTAPIGGLDYYRSLIAPYQHLDLKFLISGGITPMQVRRYLGESGVMAIGGSWIAPRQIIEKQNWSAVIDQATEAAGIVKEQASKTSRTRSRPTFR